MKNALLILMTCFSAYYASSQDTIRVGALKVPIQLDTTTSTSTYFVFNRVHKREPSKLYVNAPSSSYETYDSYQRPITVIDTVTSCQCMQLDTLNRDKLDIKLYINGREFENVKFAYQILATDARVSHTVTEIVNSSEVTKKLSELMNSFTSGVLLLYGITFTEGEDMYTMSIGYTCMVK